MSDTTAEIVLFDGFDELDAIGPFEVLENAAEAGGDLETRLVTLEGDTDEDGLVTASHGLRVEPEGTLGRPDLLIVPGGGWTTPGGVRAVVEDGALPDAVGECYENGATVASVCTGAMILSHAGLLEGRPAATHHVAVDDLEAAAATVVDERVVDDGDVLSAGGVTSGIDLALWLVEREFGEEIASDVSELMVHERRGAVFTSSSD
ncbi:DJ-1/PfpI family protein [Natrarchaeobaculum sulfurireducens]|uniref:Intracellular protease/amidase n=1 Tax=Natrarchaeobaculum sulfurireducens TaxID=2044521 RepID=A0A346PV81_9EURY|nr:DJ-1/PfpI family protein [Natrarchaeobaculum sulfurireducens]AXR79684.1 Putative intracellular protease/amidase [Natrarchaeobaculum sulfurireducens]AXR83426.1 ThiJ/PfpI family protein [Natrarchaeobaculum sulfurireducens]